MIKVILILVTNLVTTFCAEWTDASWSDYPYMALVYTTKSGGTGACGGSILSLNECGRGIILTAAHCVDGGTNVRVGIGCTKTSYSCTDAGAKYYDDDYYVMHPDYDGSATGYNFADNDVALIFLSEPITVTNARPISLHSDISVMQNNDDIRVLGYYGDCSYLDNDSNENTNCNGGSDTDTLEYADTHYMATSECDDLYGSYVTGGHDFCIKDDDASKQTICQGDSGSPLVFQNKQIGVNSWVIRGCDPNNPQVAASVPYYYKWISETRAAQPQCNAPYEYIGCYKDTSNRALRYGPHAYGYTAATCSAACANYQYFALQNGGWCCCDDSLSHAIKYGQSTNCPASQLGGGWANDLFRSTIARSEYIGCYRDTSNRALRYGPHAYGYTPETCSAACGDYQYFALQNNGWCCCDDSLSHATQYGTATNCPASQLGGGWANDLFEHNIARCEYIGCYKDTSNRALRYGPKAYGYTKATCSAACADYQYFALQNGGWCCCDNDLNHATKYGTATNCPDSQLGGGWANDLFEHAYGGCSQSIIGLPDHEMPQFEGPPNELNNYKPIDGEYYIEISKPILLAIAGLIAFVIVINFILMCYNKKNKKGNTGYHVVKHMDSDSEYA